MSRGSDSFIAPDIAQRPANTPAKPSGDHIPLGGFVLTSMRPMMIADRHDHFRIFQSPKPEWAQIWHLWTAFIPRRSITGRLIFGQVWRRHDGRRWIYKTASIEQRITQKDIVTDKGNREN
jgi:hypothetical protein